MGRPWGWKNMDVMGAGGGRSRAMGYGVREEYFITTIKSRSIHRILFRK